MAVAAGNTIAIAIMENGRVFGVDDNDANRLYPLSTTLPDSSGPVRQVAAGSNHMGIVTDGGNLFMCGQGVFGRLGLGDEDNRATPNMVAREVFDGEAVLMVACGRDHTAVVTEGGGVFTFGFGEPGHLGHGDKSNQLLPRRVPAAAFRPNGSAERHGEEIVMVAAGFTHTVALSNAGDVFTWGYGRTGALGHGEVEELLVPRQVQAGQFGSEKVVFVAAGGYHTVAVTAGGRLYTWGRALHGQLGHGDNANRMVPTPVEGFGTPLGKRVVMAACGFKHTLAVTQNGGLWTCGSAYNNIIGFGDNTDRYVFERLEDFGSARVLTAAASSKNSWAVTHDGALWVWGEGRNARLGRGPNQPVLLPTRVARSPLSYLKVCRLLPLPLDHALAFAMGCQGRLGEKAKMKDMPQELVKMIVGRVESTCGLDKARHKAVLTLIGGGWMYEK